MYDNKYWIGKLSQYQDLYGTAIVLSGECMLRVNALKAGSDQQIFKYEYCVGMCGVYSSINALVKPRDDVYLIVIYTCCFPGSAVQ